LSKARQRKKEQKVLSKSQYNTLYKVKKFFQDLWPEIVWSGWICTIRLDSHVALQTQRHRSPSYVYTDKKPQFKKELNNNDNNNSTDLQSGFPCRPWVQGWP